MYSVIFLPGILPRSLVTVFGWWELSVTVVAEPPAFRRSEPLSSPAFPDFGVPATTERAVHLIVLSSL